jgi:hypothetical protein
VKRGRSTGKQTKAEAAHVQAVKRSGCLCCIALGYAHDPDGPMVEAHHLLSGGIRLGHMHTLGLCPWHHRGQPFVAGWSIEEHRERLGPPLSEGSVTFHARFGSDQELQRQQRQLLRGEA